MCVAWTESAAGDWRDTRVAPGTESESWVEDLLERFVRTIASRVGRSPAADLMTLCAHPAELAETRSREMYGLAALLREPLFSGFPVLRLAVTGSAVVTNGWRREALGTRHDSRRLSGRGWLG